MPALPLLAHAGPADTVAYRHDGTAVPVRRFLADVAHLEARLPATRHVLNACSDRYRFAVGLAACLVSGRISLLPSSHTPQTLAQMADFAPDCVLLADTPRPDCPLPVMAYPAGTDVPPADAPAMPAIAPGQQVAWVFTSGSTGTPRPHPKHWGPLVANVQNEARALGVDRHTVLVGTVPPQHMYGFESTVLMAWQSGAAFDGGRPFFPADIQAALARHRAPVRLVTTPFHLRTLLESGLALPTLAGVVCATAPLAPELAARAEAAFGAPLIEIYGSTETGQLATRRSAQETLWTPFPGVRLQPRDGQSWAEGGHIEAPVMLGDLIEHAADGRFRLLGRQADLINIAGKRTSLGWLNRQLLAIDGVVDGCFHQPDAPAGPGDIQRLAAFAVAPGLTPATLLAALRPRIDPVFLPRPLVLVEALPRNATGKLTRQACDALYARHRSAPPS